MKSVQTSSKLRTMKDPVKLLNNKKICIIKKDEKYENRDPERESGQILV